MKVYAQVNLDNCPRQSLNKSDLRSVEGIIFRYNHLRQNVKHIDFGEYRTYRSNIAEHYDHSIWVNLMVSTAFLWENARSYIWKHMGQHEWRLDDGTKMTMNRIHVKT